MITISEKQSLLIYIYIFFHHFILLYDCKTISGEKSAEDFHFFSKNYFPGRKYKQNHLFISDFLQRFVFYTITRMNHPQYNPESENLLWYKVVNDDEKAFEKIFTLFYPALFIYAKKFIEDKSVREDIIQDVFVSLWEDRKKRLIPSSLRNYLMVSVRNHCLNFLKKEKRIHQYRESAYKEQVVSDEEKDAIYTLTELYDMLEKALKKLPDNYRIVFEMHRMEGEKYEDIAKKLNLSLRTVKRYQSQALEILREDLKDYLPLLYFVC